MTFSALLNQGSGDDGWWSTFSSIDMALGTWESFTNTGAHKQNAHKSLASLATYDTIIDICRPCGHNQRHHHNTSKSKENKFLPWTSEMPHWGHCLKP